MEHSTVTCEHEGCEDKPILRSPFCATHKAEHRRLWNRDRMRAKRERQADSIVALDVAVSDGRSIPGQGADAHTPTTQHHPSRRFARQAEPDVVVDYTQPGATAHRSAFEARMPRTDLQRWEARHVPNDDAWSPEPDEEYYAGVDFRARNDMGHGPYRGGYVPAGNPVAFEVWRVSR